MELRFTKDQEALRRAVRHLADNEITKLVPDMEGKEEFPSELIGLLKRRGLMGIPVPKEYGGAGADFISYIIAINEISRVSAAAGVILSVHTSVGTWPILLYGTSEQKEKYVTRLASGEWLGAFALTEASAGSDAASIRTSAVREGGHYVLEGSKLFITNAGAADTYVTFAVTDSAKGPRGITAFIITRDTPGLRIGKSEKKMGLHGSNTCELVYDGMRVSAAQRLGEEGQGFSIAMGTLDGGRIGIAAQALGIAQAALAEAVRRLKPRKGAVNPSPAHFRLAELAAQTEAARLLVYRAASLRQSGLPCTKEASMAKLFASDTAVAVSSAVVRLLGQEGRMIGHPAERFFRDAKVTQIYEGTNEIHRIVIGNQLLLK